MLELERPGLGKGAGLLMGEDQIKWIGFELRAVRIVGAAGQDSKPAIIVFAELG
jgi:hypothetical protein